MSRLLPNFKDYTSIKELHKGGLHIVYLAKDETNDQFVILKELNEFNNNANSEKLLKTEFELGSRINSEFVVAYKKIIEDQKKTILVREYFESERLIECIPNNGFDIQTFLELSIQLVKGIIDIHNGNVIHQLLKPSNILLNKNKQLKIIDFGRATQKYNVNSNVNNFNDSIPFISPEQTGRMNRLVDYRTDFYTLGITCYLMLTGKTPYAMADTLTMVHSHIAKQPESLSEVKKDIPKPVSDIIFKLLEKNAENRYQSAEGLLFDLDYCLKNINNEKSLNKFKIGKQDFSSILKIPQKLYGREEEIELLHNQFNKVCTGDTVILMVTGYSGIGKTTIVNELQKQITIKDAYFSSGKYEHLKRNVAYSAIASAFKDLIAQILSESTERLEIWRNKFLNALGFNGQIIIDIIPNLELIIGKQPPVEELGTNETQNRFNAVFQHFVSVFDKMAHPLVIFLDDLQWIDLASLNLIKLITSERLTKSFFFIGAYRSNEVYPTHPAIKAINDINNTGVEVKYIKLKPLDLNHINNWVSDTLNSTMKETEPLAKLIIQKTNGNPFFTKSFLQNLHSEKLINHIGNGKWKWDLDEIIATEPTDNVTILMAGKIKKLDSEIVHMLKYASCLGISFKLSTLAIILNSESTKLEKHIESTLIEGMLIKQRNNYKFVHDKVLEAAYSLINEEQKPSMHLEIGRLMISKLDKKEINANIFNIAEHFNKGVQLIDLLNEGQQIFEINMLAAEKAKNSAAYKNAGYYFNLASNLIDETSWQKNYTTTLKFYTEWAEAEYMSSNFEETERLFDVVLCNANSVLDKTKIYQMVLTYNENRKNFREAVEISIKVLQELKIPFTHPNLLTPNKKDEQTQRFHSNIKKVGVNEIINLPEIENSIYKEAIGVLVSVMVPYWNTYPEALEYLTHEIANLSMEHGLCAEASLGFALLGSIVPKDVDNINLGYKLGKIAIDITDRFENRFYEAGVKYTFYNHILYWKESVTHNIDKLIDAYHIGLDTGNNQWASYCLNHFCMRHVIAGTKLSVAKQYYDKYVDAIYRLKLKAPLTYYNPPRQAVDNLLGLVNDVYILTGEAFNEKTDLNEFFETKQFSAIGLTYIFKLMLFNVFGETQKAFEITQLENCENYIRANSGQLQPYIGLCFLSLSITRNFDNIPAKDKSLCIKNVELLLDEFANYSKINPLNFEPLYTLMLADYSRVKKDVNAALNFYDKAAELAKKGGYLYFEALANELAGLYWQKRGKQRIANAYIADAYSCYENWECKPKLALLRASFSSIFEKQEKKDTINLLDINSIQKVTQALSSEIEINSLVAKLIEIIIKNAGAQKGCITLGTSENAKIIGGFNLDAEAPQYIEEDLSLSNKIPEPVIRYVLRTGTQVIESNTVAEGEFTKEEYIRENKVRSMLCMPIELKRKTIGVLYLENNLSKGVFSENRINILKIILAQAAISIENARLFTEHEKAIEDYKTEKVFLNTAIDTLIDTFYVFEVATGKPILWNKAFTQISEYTDEEISELKAPESYYSKSDLEKASKAINSVLDEGVSVVEIDLITKSGKTVPTEYTSGILKDSNGNAKYIISIGRNSTERKKNEENLRKLNDRLAVQNEEYIVLNEELNNSIQQVQQMNVELTKAKQKAEEGDRLKTEFINNMSHEIRTPMNGIMGFSDLLNSPDIDASSRSYYINIIKNSSNQLLRIIDDILEISKLETKQVKPILAEVCINHLFLNLFSIFDIRAKEKGIPLYLHKGLSDNDCVIKTDESKLNKIISNLLENAFKFTHEGCIEFGYNVTNNKLVIFIKDTGIGINKEKQKKIFYRFSQEEESSQHYGGLGLGLSIAKENAELLGGRITINSEKDKGSTFYVTLPFTKVQNAKNIEEISVKQKNKATILIVEDEEINHIYLEEVISSEMPCNLIHAKNGKEAIAICRQTGNIDLILMDLKLPILNGYDATKQIRKLNIDVPIIAQTAYSTEDDKTRALNAGCTDFIAKPIAKHEIIELINKHLQSQ